MGKHGTHKNRVGEHPLDAQGMLKGTMVAGSPTIKQIFKEMHNKEKGTNFRPYDQAHKVGGLTETERHNQQKIIEMQNKIGLDVFGQPSKGLLRKHTHTNSYSNDLTRDYTKDYS